MQASVQEIGVCEERLWMDESDTALKCFPDRGCFVEKQDGQRGEKPGTYDVAGLNE